MGELLFGALGSEPDWHYSRPTTKGLKEAAEECCGFI
jgi:hypothetical protein